MIDPITALTIPALRDAMKMWGEGKEEQSKIKARVRKQVDKYQNNSIYINSLIIELTFVNRHYSFPVMPEVLNRASRAFPAFPVKLGNDRHGEYICCYNYVTFYKEGTDVGQRACLHHKRQS